MTGIDINTAGLKPLDASKLNAVHVSEAPQELFDRIMDMKETMLEHRCTQRPDVSQHPAYQPYATVTVNGKVVAEIDNNGFVKTSNAVGRELGYLPETSMSGPNLAQSRADYIAHRLGGQVEKAETALRQAEFAALPKVKPIIDQASLKNDPLYKELEALRAQRALYLAQEVG